MCKASMDRETLKVLLTPQRFNVGTACHVAYVQVIIKFLPYKGQHVHIYGFDGSSNTLS
jgi:hypothetical protein